MWYNCYIYQPWMWYNCHIYQPCTCVYVWYEFVREFRCYNLYSKGEAIKKDL
jgi:hypothetical protein